MTGDETSDRINVLRYGDAMIAHKLASVGLGLPLCHRYAALLGGSLKLDSIIGKGTTATLRFPLRPVGAPAASKAQSAA